MEGDSPPTAISPPATKSPTADCRVASPASRSPPDATEGEVPAALVTEGPVPAVPEDEFDEPPFDDGTDSAYGDQSIYSDTTSLRSSIMKYREEHGRTYHSYGSTEHWGPNDSLAQDQQDISHHFWGLMLKGELYLAPVENPQRILDLGTGTGIWAIDVAEKHPEAVVKGIDVSPIQPRWVPPNAKFEIDDFNLAWGDANKYDLIHERELLGSVPNWPEFYAKCFRALKPGGWIDCAEPDLYFESYHNTLGEDHCYKQWSEAMLEAGNRAGMSFDVGPYIKDRLESVGFINVVERKLCITIGRWSNDPWEREVGVWEQLRLDRGVQDFCSRRFVNNLGWRIEEVEVLCARMRAAIRNNKLLAHQWFYLVVGQKPLL